ncbi:DUF2780 domain-containing protein [Vitiosangium sp. GDMCC 1.1324]|uniref:DUF2780 domain-containing protein n=1 Tax=Vitiosangium sp. (strain GDMCC 1.1324) TaxID=2138576 RepID=UPI000D35A5AA|nr:DUF2780 domain-containing protein [Vitiosangium sp. GDMCC 1.1324]PTL80467.1 hypothetical protein DAT35_27920 [Vitiosangium sp. GDMCC 1.1324]
MDFIGQLSQQLGVDSNQAQGLAGSLLKLVQGTVQEKMGPQAADQLGQAIPEMQGWQQQAEAQTQQGGAGEGGGLMGALGGLGGLLGGQGQSGGGGLMGALGGAMGQAGEVAGLVALLQRFNLDAGKASLVAPLLLNFLKSRLDPKLVGGILAVMPMLANLGGGGGTTPEGGGSQGGGGGLGGLLGGLIR